jgi:redox-sensitive bicupin YhaK (pirin superfamily)
MVGADLQIDGGAAVTIPLRADFEHAVLVIEGSVEVADVELNAGPLLYLGTGRSELRLASSVGARLVLLGGEPFPDELVMWWNFVGRSHEEIVQARADWENHAARFGAVDGHGADRIPAPPMPPMRLTARRRVL